jgi:hypothetical protein
VRRQQVDHASQVDLEGMSHSCTLEAEPRPEGG